MNSLKEMMENREGLDNTHDIENLLKEIDN